MAAPRGIQRHERSVRAWLFTVARNMIIDERRSLRFRNEAYELDGWTPDRVTSDTWESYPILRFSEIPAVDVKLLPGNGNPPLGVGETAQGPTAAAIGNALYDALGVRVRTLPFTQEQIVAAMPA
jgi:CO/xanthine dehydrogenase Mo-binding subunit